MIFEEYIGLISELSHVPREAILESSSFRDDLGIDSLQMVHLITRISLQWHVGIEVLESNEDFLTVGSLYRAFQRGG